MERSLQTTEQASNRAKDKRLGSYILEAKGAALSRISEREDSTQNHISINKQHKQRNKNKKQPAPHATNLLFRGVFGKKGQVLF